MTLTEAWENAGRPRPPFKYLFDHPDGRDQWFHIDLVTVTPYNTVFRDDNGPFNGDLVKVRDLEKQT